MRHLVLPVLFVLFTLALGACERDNPANCQSDDECKPGRCVSFRCEVDAGDAGGRLDAHGGADGDAGGRDGPGLCGGDPECPAEAPLCLAGRCGRCAGGADCAGRPGRVCDTTSGRCVECRGAVECTDAARPVCVQGACMGCGSGAPDDCSKRDLARPACDAGSGRCVACTSASHCAEAGRPLCLANQCASCSSPGAPADGCRSKSAALPVCETASGRCVECVAIADCAAGKPICAGNRCLRCDDSGAAADACLRRDAKLPACDTAAGRCVECTGSGHCMEATKPICEAQKCVPCAADAQCAAKLGPDPGVCMLNLGGRCATDGETLYVRNAPPACSDTGSGTAALPFCHPQPAVMAATSSRRLVLLRGPAAFFGFSASTATPLSVLGHTGAFIQAGAGIGIRVASSELYVRGVTVRGSSEEGVVVEPGATLVMTRCLVESNAKGGIHVKDGAGYDITNTVVAGNGPGSVGPTTWGGVLIAIPGAGKPARFVNNTVVRNMGPGLSCSGPVAAPGTLAQGNSLVDIGATCMLAACCTGDPLLTSSHRLMTGSPCIDKLDPAMSAPDDIDGDRRPQGASSDCGADEWKP